MSYDKDKFAEIVALTHSEQAIWWLNGFWNDGAEADKEQIWEWTHQFIELQTDAKVLYGSKSLAIEEGCDLDEFKAHRFLEMSGQTMTVVDMRKFLKEIDVDSNNRMALSEYLLAKYQKTPNELCIAPQGDNEAEIKAAQEQMEAVSKALAELTESLEAQKKALAEQKVAEEAAKNALAEQKVQEAAAATALKAQEEAEAKTKAARDAAAAADAELKSQQDAYDNAVAALEAKVNDPSLSTVKKGTAINELAQLKDKDPLPLDRARITQAAALKRVEKELKKSEAATAEAAAKKEAAEAATKEAEAQAAAAEEARKESEKKAAEVEAAVKETEGQMAEAQQMLEAAKSGGGVANGAIWWMERKLEEQRKFLPSSRR